MFFVKEPSTLGSPWILSHHKDKQVVAISKDTTRDLKSHQILGIDFLYQNYRKQLKGAILNEENGMNMQIQVAAFLNATFSSVEQQFLVLVITPDDLVVNWHYHLKIHGGLKVQIVSPSTCPEDFDQEHGLALILSFSNLKLAEYLIDYDYFTVVIDAFDEIASKLIIKKLTGQFNIGLTERSFYVNPNQKLQWTMINWSNPGCVGKLADFYEIDNDNFANFRDNYRHWWFRLTWNFCESFNEITYEEKQEYIRSLTKWALANHITNIPSVKAAKKVRKRKKLEMIEDTSEKSGDEQKNKVVKKMEPSKGTYNNNDSEDIDQEIVDDKRIKDEDESLTVATQVKNDSSQDTIIYEAVDEQVKDRDPNYVNLPSMDENPILSSIIRNFKKSPEPMAIRHSYSLDTTKYKLDEPNCSKSFENDVLMSIIDSTEVGPKSPPGDDETQLFYKKEELFSQIFHDEPCTSKSFLQTQDDNGFFQSLIESDDSAMVKKKSSTKQRKNDDVGDILKETEVLLRE